jgi:hypothetical protein
MEGGSADAPNNGVPRGFAPSALMLLYNNVAELRQNRGAKTTVRLTRALIN